MSKTPNPKLSGLEFQLTQSDIGMKMTLTAVGNKTKKKTWKEMIEDLIMRVHVYNITTGWISPLLYGWLGGVK